MAITNKAQPAVERGQRPFRPRQIEVTYIQAVERQVDTEKRLRERNAAWVNRFDRMMRP